MLVRWVGWRVGGSRWRARHGRKEARSTAHETCGVEEEEGRGTIE